MYDYSSMYIHLPWLAAYSSHVPRWLYTTYIVTWTCILKISLFKMSNVKHISTTFISVHRVMQYSAIIGETLDIPPFPKVSLCYCQQSIKNPTAKARDALEVKPHLMVFPSNCIKRKRCHFHIHIHVSLQVNNMVQIHSYRYIGENICIHDLYTKLLANISLETYASNVHSTGHHFFS